MEQHTQDKALLRKEISYQDRVKEATMNARKEFWTKYQECMPKVKEGSMKIVKEGSGLFDGVVSWAADAIWNAVKGRKKEEVKKEMFLTREDGIPITGTMAIPERQEIIKALPLDTKLTLVPVPSNGINDEKAIGVFAGDVQLGWIPARPIEGWEVIPKFLIYDKMVLKKKEVRVARWWKVGGTAEYPKVGIRLRLYIEK